MKRKLEDTAKEPNKSSRYATRATTRATTIEGEVDHVTDPRKGNSSSNNEGRAMLQKALELLGEYRAEFQGLREAIKEQNGIISNQQEVIRDLKEAAEEQQNTAQELSQQLEDTKKQMGDELKRIREQLEAITASAAATPHISLADVMRSPPSSQPSNIPSGNISPSNLTDAFYCTVDTSRVEKEEGELITASAIRTIVESEVRAGEGQSSWRCQALTKDRRSPTRIRIVCRDEAEHQMVKRLVGAKLARGARVLRDELYPIKVDNVKRIAVLDEAGNIRTGAAEAFGKENDTQIAKIVWLSKRDIPKAYGSMVVYLTKGSDSRRLLSEGFFYAGGESGYARAFERRLRPNQCYNCQQVGHKAFQCNNTQVCGKCAKEGHHHSTCNGTIFKCVLCGGPHESFSRNCKKLYPSPHE